ncbi:hypothetical protein KEM60_00105 [Austwickia sp. TVS 96-490-7B]|nr:hypothetical protein [Austwickia sp. TVS 96-490-7B]
MRKADKRLFPLTNKDATLGIEDRISDATSKGSPHPPGASVQPGVHRHLPRRSATG